MNPTSSSASSLCSVCSLPASKVSTRLECECCRALVHIGGCLSQSPAPLPTALLGDTFFTLTCAKCSHNRTEVIKRAKISWTMAMCLCLYNLRLTLNDESRRGYFHWKTHIAVFLEKHWDCILGPQLKKRKNWLNTLAGTLSHWTGEIFISGSSELGETGWWKIASDEKPADIIANKGGPKPSSDASKSRASPLLSGGVVVGVGGAPAGVVEGKRTRGVQSSIRTAMALKEKRATLSEAKDIRRALAAGSSKPPPPAPSTSAAAGKRLRMDFGSRESAAAAPADDARYSPLSVKTEPCDWSSDGGASDLSSSICGSNSNRTSPISPEMQSSNGGGRAAAAAESGSDPSKKRKKRKREWYKSVTPAAPTEVPPLTLFSEDASDEDDEDDVDEEGGAQTSDAETDPPPTGGAPGKWAAEQNSSSGADPLRTIKAEVEKDADFAEAAANSGEEVAAAAAVAAFSVEEMMSTSRDSFPNVEELISGLNYDGGGGAAAAGKKQSSPSPPRSSAAARAAAATAPPPPTPASIINRLPSSGPAKSALLTASVASGASTPSGAASFGGSSCGDAEDAVASDAEASAAAGAGAADAKQTPAPERKAHSPEPRQPLYIPMSIYEEQQLLRELLARPSMLATNLFARQLRRKLVVRQLQRSNGIKVFDLDDDVVRLLGVDRRSAPPQTAEKPLALAGGGHAQETSRVLDRFHRKDYHANVSKHGGGSTFRMKLVGCDNTYARTVISPYTGRELKPFIRRDYDSEPLKLKLLREIAARTANVASSPEKSPRRHPIDYCYVQPHHIHSVNALAQQFFWPAIDVTECLEYPDFSCVALYRRIVIGFAFLVPNVSHTDAYITFVFTHPEWRRAGIATFMLYHLVQTCRGRDLSLHVSVNNPAVMLYQKFGFKVEEHVSDFYDKYLPPNSSECKHALLLRLAR